MRRSLGRLAVLLVILGFGFHVAADRIDTTTRLCDLSLPLDPVRAAEKEAECRRFLAEGEENLARERTFQLIGNVLLGAFALIALATVVIDYRTMRFASGRAPVDQRTVLR